MYHFLVQLLEPLTLLVVLLLGVVVWYWFRAPDFRPQLRRIGIPVLLLYILSTPVAGYWASQTLETRFAREPTIPSGPVIVVLSGYATDEQLGYDSMYRCLKAVEIARQHPPHRIYCSGGRVLDDGKPSLASRMRDFLETQELPADTEIVLEDKSRSTYENARYTAEQLLADDIHEVVVVTDASHLYRAVHCFEAQGIKVIPCGCSYSEPLTWRASQLLPTVHGALGVQRACHEWTGIVYYYLRGNFRRQSAQPSD